MRFRLAPAVDFLLINFDDLCVAYDCFFHTQLRLVGAEYLVLSIIERYGVHNNNKLAKYEDRSDTDDVGLINC